MKKKCLLAGLACCLLGMTACTTAISLEEDKEDMMAQYLAEKILYHDENYKDALLTTTPIPSPTSTSVTESITMTPTPSVDVTQAPDTNPPITQGSSNEQANADLTQVIGISGIEAEYIDYELVESFTENAFILEPSKGNVLFVAKINLVNATSDKIAMNLINRKIDYMLDINTEKRYRPLSTMNDNDLNMFCMDLEPAEKQSVLLIFEVPKKLDMKSINLIASSQGSAAIVKIK